MNKDEGHKSTSWQLTRSLESYKIDWEKKALSKRYSIVWSMNGYYIILLCDNKKKNKLIQWAFALPTRAKKLLMFKSAPLVAYAHLFFTQPLLCSPRGAKKRSHQSFKYLWLELTFAPHVTALGHGDWPFKHPTLHLGWKEITHKLHLYFEVPVIFYFAPNG